MERFDPFGKLADAQYRMAQMRMQQDQNALATQLQRIQVEEAKRAQAQQVANQGAQRGLYENIDYLQGDFPQRSGELINEMGRQYPGADLSQLNSLAQQFKPVAPEYQIIDGQYVPKQPGGQAVPIPGFTQKPEKPGKQVERTVDLGNKVEYIYTDGTREFKPKAASPNTVIMGNQKTPKMEMDMRKEFTALPEVKAHVEISSQIQRLEKAMDENQKTGSKVAVDQALITILNKMLDPSSVVRESEYARTPGDLAFLNRMRGKIEKLKTGGAGLTDEDREAIASMARNFASVSQSMYDEQANYYGGLAERYGYNPENVVRLGGPKKKRPGTPAGGIKFLGFE